MSQAASTLRVVVRRVNAAVHFLAETGSGARVSIDGAPAIGGQGLGARPMELLLAGLGGCSGIDVVGILTKQRQPVEDVTVAVEGARAPGEPSVFERIHVHITVQGPTDANAVARAVALSMDRYCSVARVLERSASITYSHDLVPAVGTRAVGSAGA
ncbi:MAG TPA: OsmC family protein [Gemmatimonadales bacterium]|nr:OsmC family protein [Gemmatimonadales bacterium]